jgi:hypothetical protein
VGSEYALDGVNEVQVRDRRALSPAQLIDRFYAAAPKAIRTRTALPRPLRAVPVPFPPPLGRRSVAYLVDRVISRDVWMHRIDICRAVGAEPVLTAEHDGRLIADMVADWATTHPDPFALKLGGPAGGRYRRGDPTTTTEIDAVECIHVLSGRASGEGVLAHPLPL